MKTRFMKVIFIVIWGLGVFSMFALLPLWAVFYIFVDLSFKSVMDKWNDYIFSKADL